MAQSEYRTEPVDVSNCECCHCEMLRLRHVRENPEPKSIHLSYEEMFDILEARESAQNSSPSPSI